MADDDSTSKAEKGKKKIKKLETSIVVVEMCDETYSTNSHPGNNITVAFNPTLPPGIRFSRLHTRYDSKFCGFVFPSPSPHAH